MLNIESLIKKLTLEEKIAMIHGAGFFRTEAVERLGIPELIMSDGPNGVRQEFPDDSWIPVANNIDYVSWLPSNTCLASTWNTNLAYEFGNVLGQEARGRGKDVILAPGLNIKRTPLCGRNFEYMTEDPFLCGKMAVPLVQGIQSNDVAACAKHFALNNQEYERMTVDVQVDEKTLRDIYLPAFYETLISGSCSSVMSAYNRFRGDYCSNSKTLINDILRDEWKYRGVVISDWGAVHDTEETTKYGVDIEMSVTTDFDDYFMAKPLIEKVKNGEIDEKYIDEKVRRIISMMYNLRMFEDNRKSGVYAVSEHADILLKVAEEGIVLLKNEKEHLPVEKYKKDSIKKKRYLVVGDNANRFNALGGGSSEVKSIFEITPLQGISMVLGGNAKVDWLQGYYIDNEKNVIGDVDWQAESLSVDYENGSVDGSELARIKDEQEKLRKEVIDAIPDYDEVIFVGGLNHSFDVEGFDKKSMALPYAQDELIEAMAAATDNLTVVLMCGSAVLMPWIDKVHSLIQTSYAGMNGGYALARVIFGEVNPSGKLPETYPLRYEDTPAVVYDAYPGEIGEDGIRHVEYKEKELVGYRYYTTKDVPVLFPFGYGLSYTTFDIENIRIEKRVMKLINNFQITITCEVQNTGVVDGKETIQVYMQSPNKDMPVRVLKGFKKVELKPSEKKEVTIILTQKELADYNVEKGAFVAPKGSYKLYIGTSCNDIIEEVSFEVEDDFDI